MKGFLPKVGSTCYLHVSGGSQVAALGELVPNPRECSPEPIGNKKISQSISRYLNPHSIKSQISILNHHSNSSFQGTLLSISTSGYYRLATRARAVHTLDLLPFSSSILNNQLQAYNRAQCDDTHADSKSCSNSNTVMIVR